MKKARTQERDDWFKEIFPQLRYTASGGKKPPRPPPQSMTKPHYIDLPSELLEESDALPSPPEVEYIGELPPIPGEFYIPQSQEAEPADFKEESQSHLAGERLLQGPFIDPLEELE